MLFFSMLSLRGFQLAVFRYCLKILEIIFTSDILLLPKYWSLEMDLAFANRFVASPLLTTELLVLELFVNLDLNNMIKINIIL